MGTNGRDIHSPANIDPADYTFAHDFYQGNSDEMQEAYMPENSRFYADYEAHLARPDHYHGNFATKSTCDHCGTAFAYGVAYRHEPTGDLVAVGHICAEETFRLPNRVAVNKRNKQRQAEALKLRAEAREALSPEARAAVDFLQDGGIDDLRGGYAGFIADVLGKALRLRYPLSEKQQAALIKAHKSILERREERANRPEEIKVEPPTGRVEFTGEIISVKVYENSEWGDYLGTTVKVGTDDGMYLVWFRVPKALHDPERGDTVSVRASLTRMDVGMAIGKRPHLLDHTRKAVAA